MDNKSTLLLQSPQITKDLQIKNYQSLISDAKLVEQKYINFTGTNKQVRKLRTKLNHLSNGLNNLRKEKSRPYRKDLKVFKAKIDHLRNYISKVTDKLSQPLQETKDYKLSLQQAKDQQVMDRICARYHVSPIQVPKHAFKKSLSKAKRLAIIIQLVRERAEFITLKSATPIYGHAITQNGEDVGIAQKLLFMGNPEKLNELLNFAKKNKIILKEIN